MLQSVNIRNTFNQTVFAATRFQDTPLFSRTDRQFLTNKPDLHTEAEINELIEAANLLKHAIVVETTSLVEKPIYAMMA